MKESRPHVVQSRFDQETELWNSYHHSGEPTLVHREIVLRKRLAKQALLNAFKGRSLRVLEIGCGTGVNLKEIVELDAQWTGVGVDISPNMIRVCDEKFSDEDRLSFSVLDIEERSLSDAFDAIILLGVVGYFKDTKRAFTNICSMLRPGGVLVFTYGNRRSLFRKMRWLFSRWSFMRPTYVLGNVVRRLFGKKPVAYKQERSHFVSIHPREIRELVDACGAEIVEEHGLLYASGVLGRISVWSSRLIEFFVKKDNLDQAFTKFIVVKKK